MLTKKELRKEIVEARKNMSPEDVAEKSELICSRIVETSFYGKATDICIYMPIRNEVDVTLLIPFAEKDGKGIWIPKVIGEEMIFNAYEEDKIEISGSFKIRESTSEKVLVPDENTLIVMPGAVFDVKGNRIGYGGGYYDRYLEKHPMCSTLAVCYDLQVVKELPAEPHDIKPQMIVTETSIGVGVTTTGVGGSI